MYNKVKLKNYCKLITHGVITQESDQSTSHHNLVTHCLAMFGHTVDQSHLTSHLITCCLPLFGSVADQSWTVMNPILDFKINNIVKDIRDIKSTFKNRKNNQNSLDKYGEDEKVNKYFSHNNPKYHDRTSNHDIPKHHGLLPTHNDPDTFPINQPLHPTHSCPDIDESGIEPTSSYGFPSSRACTTDMERKPSSSPNDPSSRIKGSYDPSEEGVIGSSGGGELEDPDDGEATIKPLMTLRHVGIGDEESGDREEQMGEGRTGEDRPSALPAQ